MAAVSLAAAVVNTAEANMVAAVNMAGVAVSMVVELWAHPVLLNNSWPVRIRMVHLP